MTQFENIKAFAAKDAKDAKKKLMHLYIANKTDDVTLPNPPLNRFRIDLKSLYLRPFAFFAAK